MFNKIQLVIFGIIGLVVLSAVLVLLRVLPGLREREGPAFTLEVWGADDGAEVWENLGRRYREVARSATINYTRKAPERYEAELVNALAAGGGPDIFLLKDGWLSQHQDKIRTLPEGTSGYSPRGVKTEFADAIAEAIITPAGELRGVPTAFDTLALFYNRDYLNSENIAAPPQTWEELESVAERLTRRSEIGAILRSGVALGTAENVSHAPDIFMALMFQSDGRIIDPEGKRSLIAGEPGRAAVPPAAQTLAFLTAFADSRKRAYAWGPFFENSLQAFAKGDTAMAFGYARDVPNIRAQNPQLNFGVAPLPQPKDARTRINFGRFNLLAVSRNSKNADQAWRFLLWLSGRQAHKSYVDSNRLPPARRDLVNAKPPQEYLTAFYHQVLSARTIPIAGGEFLAKVIGDTIDAVANRSADIGTAISRAEARLNEFLAEQARQP